MLMDVLVLLDVVASCFLHSICVSISTPRFMTDTKVFVCVTHRFGREMEDARKASIALASSRDQREFMPTST